MADQMVQQSEPVVIGRIEPFGNLYAQYVVTNVGLGPALKVELKLNPVAPRGDSLQHPVRCHAAIFREAIVAIDGHANDELGFCKLPEVDASQRILMRQIHIDVRVNRSLSSTGQLILRAMARAAVLAKERPLSVPLLFRTSACANRTGISPTQSMKSKQKYGGPIGGTAFVSEGFNRSFRQLFAA